MFIILTFSYCKHYTIAFLAFQPRFFLVFFFFNYWYSCFLWISFNACMCQQLFWYLIACWFHMGKFKIGANDEIKK